MINNIDFKMFYFITISRDIVVVIEAEIVLKQEKPYIHDDLYLKIKCSTIAFGDHQCYS